jgi:hypothetical protein
MSNDGVYQDFERDKEMLMPLKAAQIQSSAHSRDLGAAG